MAVARVALPGPDATRLSPEQLVFIDPTIHARDSPAHAFLLGLHAGHNDVTPPLMERSWRHGTFAEYVLVPLENVIPLNEASLCGRLGYTPEQLCAIAELGVPYGGLDDIALKAGEVVVVAPATGNFGAAAVDVALAMGARVVAHGRDVEKLAGLVARSTDAEKARLRTVPMTGDVEADTRAVKAAFDTPDGIDAYFDISPAAAAGSSHFKSCVFALRHAGRVSLMGGLKKDVPLPLGWIMHANVVIKGTWMFTRAQGEGLVRMVEAGLVRLERSWRVRTFALDEWRKAWDYAEWGGGRGERAVLVP